MAYRESEVPESVRDILMHMPREMRQRVLADYETHYAPFLAMLAGWKGAVQEHYRQGEDAVIARLEEEFFPLGSWQCPAQTLAVPQRPPERVTDIDGDTQFTDAVGRPWLASGDGWLLPTALRGAQARWDGDDCWLVIECDYAGKGSPEALLRRGQLLFAAVPEDLLALMADGPWWARLPDGPAADRPARLTRHDGYLGFERDMQAARLNQRHLDLWLPAFHPYARKIACLRLEDGDADPPPDLGWLGGGASTGVRFVGRLRPRSERHRRALAAWREGARRAPAAPLVFLNPVPLVQTALADSVFYPPFHRVGEHYALRLTGVPDLYAAVAQHDGAATPVSVARLPSTDPRAVEPDVQVQFLQGDAQVTRVKLYHGALGQARVSGPDAPAVVEAVTGKLRFDAPFPPMGGATVGGAADRADWARTAWYHAVLRPPLLTEGDLAELVRQRRGAIHGLLHFHGAAREVACDPEAGDVRWRSYLWPSVVASGDGLDARGGEIPAPDGLPLIQTLRVAFTPAPAAEGLPGFLLGDAAHYLASVLSQYFVLSCFRVEGQVV